MHGPVTKAVGTYLLSAPYLPLQRAAQLFASILREQGVDERATKAIEDMGLLLDRRG